MNLARKIELAKAAIASITQHDDAPEEEIGACAQILREYLKDELAAAAKRREARKAERLAKLKGAGSGGSIRH